MELLIRVGGVALIHPTTLVERWRFDWHDVQRVRRRWDGLAFGTTRGRFVARRWDRGLPAVEEETARRFGALPWRITDPGAAERLREYEVQDCMASAWEAWRDSSDPFIVRTKEAVLAAIRATNDLPRNHFIWDGLAHRSVNFSRVYDYLNRVQDEPWARLGLGLTHGGVVGRAYRRILREPGFDPVAAARAIREILRSS